MNIRDMIDHFKTPWVLFLIPVVILFLLFKRRFTQKPSVLFSSQLCFAYAKRSLRLRLAGLSFFLRLISAVLLIISLAGPRLIEDRVDYTKDGVDIALVIDLSGSMAAEDFSIKGKRKNRLQVVKEVVQNFIEKRTTDRIALVAFSSRAYTVSPLTLDKEWLLDTLSRLELGLIKDGTAIGDGLSSALVRLKQSPEKSRVVILLTDGVNNTGFVEPIKAARIAEGMGIKVYTIGVGSDGEVPFPVEDIWGRKTYRKAKLEIDEEILKRIAKITGGEYFHATNVTSLREVYDKIDELEKVDMEDFGYRHYDYVYRYFVFAALMILALAVFLENTWLLKLP